MRSGDARDAALHPERPFDGSDPLLRVHRVPHRFGSRAPCDDPSPEHVLRPRQVHGTRVVRAAAECGGPLGEADAVVCAEPGRWIGVVTADCVPVLVATEDGACVAAIHAGWRGLAAGVVAQAVEALRALDHQRRGANVALVAAIGPHAAHCCYEVDAPVLDALRDRFGDSAVTESSTFVREGHRRLDLAALVALDLVRGGLDARAVSRDVAQCSIGREERFHSHRRDGASAGRMLHAIAAAPANARR